MNNIYRCRMAGSVGQYATVKANGFQSAAENYMQTKGMRQRIKENMHHVTIKISLRHHGLPEQTQYWTWDSVRGIEFLQESV